MHRWNLVHQSSVQYHLHLLHTSLDIFGDNFHNTFHNITIWPYYVSYPGQLQSGRSQSFQSQYGRVWVRKISIWQKVHIAMYAIIVSCKITGVGNIREPSGGCSIQDQQLGIDLCNYITLMCNYITYMYQEPPLYHTSKCIRFAQARHRAGHWARHRARHQARPPPRPPPPPKAAPSHLRFISKGRHLQ